MSDPMNDLAFFCFTLVISVVMAILVVVYGNALWEWIVDRLYWQTTLDEIRNLPEVPEPMRAKP